MVFAISLIFVVGLCYMFWERGGNLFYSTFCKGQSRIDMANIAVFLPRQVSLEMMFAISVIFVVGLCYMFWERGGKIQEIVLTKVNTKYVRSATLVDFVYALVLYIFKEVNSIPMSTTWVFCGLLAGRELAIATALDKKNIKKVFPMLTKDFFRIMIGLAISTIIVLSITYIK